ncbi:MAG: DUF4906 domain-containing protein [Bacteroidales bacterium]|nr:DUF4906 domain-containing protein [Bacteroidales bacterium]
MIKKLYLILLAALTLGLSACNEDIFEKPDHLPEGTPLQLELNFGAYDNFDVSVSTRATQTEEQENRVYNLYVMIFDADGKRIYGRLFDTNNLNATSQDDYWTHNNSNYNSGKLHITTIKKTSCTIFAVTNISPSADMMNISPERLQLVQDINSLETMVATLNQLHTARTGRFVMSGQMAGVDTEHLSGTLLLTRMDAKIRFNVEVNNAVKYQADGGRFQIVDFEPEKWQVFNLPQNAYLFEKNSDYPTRNFFNSNEVNFEEDLDHGAAFSFYSLENRYTVHHADLISQALREKQLKDAEGLNGDWKYAPQTATWVYFTGRLKINQTDANGISRIVDADVRYKVHLGDFSGNGYGDFNIYRNTSYTYNITINGVEDIRTEVEVAGNPENAPGATGDVRVVSEEVYDCDAHYSSYVFTFGSNNVDSDGITWYVKTPFSEGEPKNGDPSGLDYNWVHFRINEMNGNVYSDQRMAYNPLEEGLMNVAELVELLRVERQKLSNGESSIFDSNHDIKVTAFVDEFYYEKHPLSGEYIPDLWKQFVDQPRRVMHILSDVKRSPDKESSTIATTISIQQRSIQTIYNVHDDNLHSAWGCETIDEYPNIWAYSATEYSNPDNNVQNRGNNDYYNGRLNSCKEWGLVNANATVFSQFLDGDPRNDWETYLNYHTDNSTPELQTQYRALRYSCMTRNRDNNGNGQIDPDEVRWYMASIRQLVGIWLGAVALNAAALLYQKTGTEDGFNWRQHIISSTQDGTNSNNPLVVWAEEASSTGALTTSIIYGTNNGFSPIFSVRCIRNLGATPEMKDITYANLSTVPTDYCETTKRADGSYLFEMTHLNENAIRYSTLSELEYHNEHAIQNRLSVAFESAPQDQTWSSGGLGFDGINNELSGMNNNRFCPPGYRLPNQRELTILAYYAEDNLSASRHASRTWYSFGMYGSQKDYSKKGWAYNNGNKTVHMMTTETTARQRCVRDVE